MSTPYRQIRALYNSRTITVYQAYSAEIADAAVKHQKLNASPSFSTDRMTWIKPSWCWMMYRSGYSYKDVRQHRILALTMSHKSFIELLRQAQLAHDGSSKKTGASVIVQWDPERGPRLEKYEYRSIQIGVSKNICEKWVNEWIEGIADVTACARDLKALLDADADGIITLDSLVEKGLMPVERPFQVPEDVQQKLGMTDVAADSKEELNG